MSKTFSKPPFIFDEPALQDVEIASNIFRNQANEMLKAELTPGAIVAALFRVAWDLLVASGKPTMEVSNQFMQFSEAVRELAYREVEKKH